MAQKRMFSLQIVDTDAFLDMPISSQLLYFHLTMRADDEGFVGNPKKIMRLIGVQDDDIKILIGKRFILSFESGVVVIKHWLIHNTIRMDRFNKTSYDKEKSLIKTSENKAYTELATKWQPNDNHSVPQVKLSKVKLSKISVRKRTSSPKKETKKDDEDKFTLSEFVESMSKSPQKHIKIIGEYADTKKPIFNTKGQWREFTNRNLKTARDLSIYTMEQIEQAFELMSKDIKSDKNPKGFITKWGLETISKYLEEIK